MATQIVSQVKNQPTKQYSIQAVLNQVVDVNVSAHSLEEALAKARGLDEGEFVQIVGDLTDSDFRVTAVLEHG